MIIMDITDMICDILLRDAESRYGLQGNEEILPHQKWRLQ